MAGLDPLHSEGGGGVMGNPAVEDRIRDREKMSSEEKVCPLAPPPGFTSNCRKGLCAWWVPAVKMCSVRLLAGSVAGQLRLMVEEAQITGLRGYLANEP